MAILRQMVWMENYGVLMQPVESQYSSFKFILGKRKLNIGSVCTTTEATRCNVYQQCISSDDLKTQSFLCLQIHVHG